MKKKIGIPAAIILAAIFALAGIGGNSPQANTASSGTTAVATQGTDAAVTLIAATPQTYQHFQVVNTSSTAGFFSIDGGTNYIYLPAGPSSVQVDTSFTNNFGIFLKRVPASGVDITGVYAVCF